MAANIRCRCGQSEPPAQSVDASIAAFLDGRTNGEGPLHALFDHVLDEPIPHSMRLILQQPQLQRPQRQVG